MPTKISVLQAVQAKYDNTLDLIALTPGGLWTSEIPEGGSIITRAMPYGILQVDNTSYEWTLGDKGFYIEKVKFTIGFFSIHAAVLDNILAVFERMFLTGENAQLDFSGSEDNLIDIWPTDSGIIPAPLRDKDSNEVFQGYLEFDTWIYRTP